MLDVKMTDQMTGHENAVREIAGHEIAGHKRAAYETDSELSGERLRLNYRLSRFSIASL